MAVQGSIDSERRRKDLAELIEQSGAISIELVRQRFGVSAMTIRRDLEVLELEGAVRRVRGGAVSAPAPRSYDERLATHVSAKRAVAKKALALVPARGALAFDASTTVNALAEMIADRSELSVCTNSIPTFDALNRANGPKTYLTGGTHEPVTGSLVGALAHSGARLMHTQIFFTSADALGPGWGSSEVSLAEAEVKRCFAEAADQTVLCLDSSKLGRRSIGTALSLEQISLLVTELSPADPRLDPYREAVEIL